MVWLFALLVAAYTAGAQAVDEQEVSRTHRLAAGAAGMAYDSLVGRAPIGVAGMDPVRARMFYVEYCTPAPAGPVRPLAVIWNGGPGGSIVAMLFGGQGPKRIEGPALVDNADTLLGRTDLLYIDAVGSGFSRPATAGERSLFYQTRGEAQLALVGADVRSRVSFPCVDSGHAPFADDVALGSIVNATMRSIMDAQALSPASGVKQRW